VQIDKSELATPRGKTIGIGRVKIPKMFGFNYEIPLLSFIVLEKEDGSYISSCIHLQIDGYGNNAEKARIDMVNNVWYFLKENFNNEKYKDSCWINMYELAKANERSSALWDRYHAVQYMLAERGITTDKYSDLEKKINELQAKVNKLEKKINKLEKKHEKMNSDERIESLSDIMNSMIIEYELAEAA